MASGVYGAALHSFLVTAIADQTEASHLGMAIQSVGIAVGCPWSGQGYFFAEIGGEMVLIPQETPVRLTNH